LLCHSSNWLAQRKWGTRHSTKSFTMFLTDCSKSVALFCESASRHRAQTSWLKLHAREDCWCFTGLMKYPSYKSSDNDREDNPTALAEITCV
jgi:hypothetical protein